MSDEPAAAATPDPSDTDSNTGSAPGNGSGAEPIPPQSAVRSPQSCYLCPREVVGTCPRCGNPFCALHGAERCMDCTIETEGRSGPLPVGAVPSAIMLYGSIAILAIAALLQFVPAIYGLLRVPGPVSDTPLYPVPPGPATPVLPAGPAPAPAAATPTPGIPDEYTVVAGDTLAQIAARFNTTVEDLVAWNGLESADTILVGQVLKIPKPGKEPPPTATPVPAPAPEPPPPPAPAEPPAPPAPAESPPQGTPPAEGGAAPASGP